MVPRDFARSNLPILEDMHGEVIVAAEAAYLIDHFKILQRHLPALPGALSTGVIPSLA